MEIIKRTGNSEAYDGQKIINAIAKAFGSTGREVTRQTLESLLSLVENKLDKEPVKSVERIQDLVEQSLMESGFFEEGKRYILFRQKRYEFRVARRELISLIHTDGEGRDGGLEKVLASIQKAYQEDVYALHILKAKFISFSKETMGRSEQLSALVRAASELVSPEAPKWEFIAGRLLNHSFQEKLRQDMAQLGINSFYEKMEYLVEEGLYGDYILHAYSKAEIVEAESFIQSERDHLLTFSALDLLLKRYVIRTRKHIPMETPQEMFLGISLHLAMKEKNDRMGWVRRFYDMLSKMEVTMATPTLANARKPYHQLSSCFIDIVPDSLDGIYRSIDNFAKVSKFGGGMG
ncbi:MAG: ribonucleoside-diphosphate reductase subunit alpha, partial [Spirochaetaceae bacterium]|nr:ribonucleoside-diphosphate reductase subunit alpha [Spirochaetaceae bacterium]